MTRIDEIKRELFLHKKVSVNELSIKHKVSKVTIRKDLERLEQEGVLQRIYGGAILSESSLPPSIENRNDNDPISVLALKALNEINDGDSIFLGSGRTCCHLAKLLHLKKDLSIVTNNITALNDLMKTNSRVYLIGGEVTSTDAVTLFSSPENLSSSISNIYVSKAFTSIYGFDMKAGLTVRSIISANIYKYIPTLCKNWYLMIDSSKFNRISVYNVADISDVHCIISDKIPEEYANKLPEKIIIK